MQVQFLETAAPILIEAVGQLEVIDRQLKEKLGWGPLARLRG